MSESVRITDEMLNKKVSITKEEYYALREASATLQCLDSMGVDNWSGFSEAFDDWAEIEGDLLTEIYLS